ncbi:hypothetical protein FRC10_011543 [Ceratobasidium sp. 414]|nr:hypothetical protein FRC10_011543 [Ceratobasidium sp. 414]
MLFAAFSVLTLGLSSVLAVPFSGSTFCGTTISADDIAAAEAHFTANKVSFKAKPRAEFAAKISVYWHVIQSGADLTQGNIPESQITDSISALNNHYSGSNIAFTLAGTDRTINEIWFNTANLGTQSQTAMKAALHKGGAAALNVYTVGFTSDPGLLGYATFPWKHCGNAKDDGVVIHYSTLPGGSWVDNNEGKTLTHEAGHWLGLYHTFEGGCLGDGDHVDDTPPEASWASGCQIGRDTCPGGGVDPIDSCMNQFTPGQIDRIKEQITTYRGIKA